MNPITISGTQNFLVQVQDLNRIAIPKGIIDFLSIRKGDWVIGTIYKVEKK